MSSGKKAWLKFMQALVTAPEGAQFEVGDSWTKDRGWRPYQRIGDKCLFLSPKQARGLHETFEKMGRDPKWRDAWESMKGTVDELKAAANDCDRKNREGIIPPNAAEWTPAEGSA